MGFLLGLLLFGGLALGIRKFREVPSETAFEGEEIEVAPALSAHRH
jgi:hypothetical protein